MRTALITGGSKGFGLALAESLVVDGWSVVIDGRDGTTLAEAVRRLRERSTGQPISGIAGDIADSRHRQALLLAVADGVDLVVNNASTLGPSPQPSLADYPVDEYRRVLDVNVVAPLALAQAVLPLLRQRRGTLVNVTSDAAVEGYAGWGGYGSSKAALEQLSNVLAAEEPEVHVYWFDPGDMRTAMHQAAFPGEDISDRPLPQSVVPALRRLLTTAPSSGRFRAAELLPTEVPATELMQAQP
jgi:NAD(P)-dependent dehydrogenase (short-subunit alcohol dehydrogenase family)